MRVCAVTVTYNVGTVFRENFETLYLQVDKSIIVDNRSDEETLKTLVEIQNVYKNSIDVEIIFNKRNMGLAKAQNIGIKRAIEENYDWVLLLDHDSSLDEKMVNEMLEVYNSLSVKEQNQIAILAPNIVDVNINMPSSYLTSSGFLIKREKCIPDKKYLENIVWVIASGSMIKTSVIREVGLMREDFFIDYIDAEFCLRVKKNNYGILVISNAILHHKLGDKKLYRFFGFNIKPTLHPPSRRYYIYRNRIKVWREFFFTFPSIVIFDVLVAFYDIFKILFFEDGRPEKFKKILKGVKDGLFS
jgi:rhamnosyltransferase